MFKQIGPQKNLGLYHFLFQNIFGIKGYFGNQFQKKTLVKNMFLSLWKMHHNNIQIVTTKPDKYQVIYSFKLKLEQETHRHNT